MSFTMDVGELHALPDDLIAAWREWISRTVGPDVWARGVTAIEIDGHKLTTTVYRRDEQGVLICTREGTWPAVTFRPETETLSFALTEPPPVAA